MIQSDALRGRRVLVVEDEYMVAADLIEMLETVGAQVVGPVGSNREALALIEATESISGAVLDINLGDERVYPVADALLARNIPFVFATGYDGWVVPESYAKVPRCEKPVEIGALAPLLAQHMTR